MLNFNSVMIGSTKPKALADFYEKVFEKSADWADAGWYGWQLGDMHFMIGEHSEVKGKAKEPQRVIINFETKQVKREFKRIKDLGALVINILYCFGQLLQRFSLVYTGGQPLAPISMALNLAFRYGLSLQEEFPSYFMRVWPRGQGTMFYWRVGSYELPKEPTVFSLPT